MLPLSDFTAIWLVTVATIRRVGERAEPIALVGQDAKSGDLVEARTPHLQTIRRPPYPTGPDTLVITTDANTLFGLHLALGWPMPERLIDLLLEHRNAINGCSDVHVGGLVGALLFYGRPASDALVVGSTPQHLRRRLVAVSTLLQAVGQKLDIGRAILRGRYLGAISRIEATGIPIDGETLTALKRDWPDVRARIVRQIDGGRWIYRGERFDEEAFGAWLVDERIHWPLASSGRLDLADETWRDMARLHPQVRPLRELRTTLLSFDPSALAVGKDGRNRTPLRPFSTVTGRNAPSTKASVLGPAAWVRHLIKPAPGMAVALIDWEQQEFGIAASLAGDDAMQTTYGTGDPYLAMAKVAGAAPVDATVGSHAEIRERYKASALGVLYGIGADRLALQLGIRNSAAKALLDDHRRSFPRFWEWSADVETRALLDGVQRSVFGWLRHVKPPLKPMSLRNFPVQSAGAEMLRLACCSVTEAGISVCAPNHDALFIEAPIGDLADAVATTRRLMADASEVVLDGFALRTSIKTVGAPDRWRDHRGLAVWNAVAAAIGIDEAPAHQSDAT